MAWQSTQASLLLRVRDPADCAAWREFDSRYGELIVRYCRSRSVQQSDAEDIRQIVMLNLASALRKFQYSPERGRFRNYLGRVVRNAIARHQSRASLRMTLADHAVLESLSEECEPEADQEWERQWVQHHYRQAMRTVRKTYDAKSVDVFDRLLAGDSVAEVAEAFGMTTQAVHKVKQRIRGRLQELIAVQIREEEVPNGA